MKDIRNFSIIAHIDHGKTTLSDRILQATGSVSERDFKDLMLDSMELEKERGITIKSSAVAMKYTAQDGQVYRLNLIDTPGHVDFSYEVSRALAGCEGAILVIDATQGVQAQTVANLFKAIELDLEVIPVVNKIDLASADPERILAEIEDELGLPMDTAVLVSAKTGQGVPELLEAVIKQIPPPVGEDDSPLRALIFDSMYNPYRGTIVHIRIMDGTLKPGMTVKIHSSGKEFLVEETGVFSPAPKPVPQLCAGEVGYFMASIKSVEDTPTGDTVLDAENMADKPLPGFVEARPVVFSSLYPASSDDFEDLGVALAKLKLNDAALDYQKESSVALGSGFRCGFLGLLHAEITTERLIREFDLELFVTAPSVQYMVTMRGGEVVTVQNPSLYPDPADIQTTEEPFIHASIIMPDRYLGAIMKLCLERRGVQPLHKYIGDQRIELTVELPLAEVVYDFYDRLKSLSQGYGSFDYSWLGFRVTDMVKLDIKVNGENVDALSILLHRDRAQGRAREICRRLQEEIPRHQFKIAIQGAIGGKIIARETVSAVRKDVTSKCYGGDITRKRKLLEKQKVGKKRMRTFGKVAIPQKAFLSVLRSRTDKND